MLLGGFNIVEEAQRLSEVIFEFRGRYTQSQEDDTQPTLFTGALIPIVIGVSSRRSVLAAYKPRFGSGNGNYS